MCHVPACHQLDRVGYMHSYSAYTHAGCTGGLVPGKRSSGTVAHAGYQIEGYECDRHSCMTRSDDCACSQYADLRFRCQRDGSDTHDPPSFRRWRKVTCNVYRPAPRLLSRLRLTPSVWKVFLCAVTIRTRLLVQVEEHQCDISYNGGPITSTSESASYSRIRPGREADSTGRGASTGTVKAVHRGRLQMTRGHVWMMAQQGAKRVSESVSGHWDIGTQELWPVHELRHLCDDAWSCM